MKKIALLLIFPIVTLTSCTNIIISGSGIITTQSASLSNYSSIEVHGVLELILTLDTTETVRIEADENFHPYMQISQDDNNLTFKVQDNISFSGASVKVYVSLKTINKLSGSGFVTISSTNALKLDRLQADISGSSTLTADLECSDFTLDISGASSADLKGSCTTFTLNSSGASSFGSFNFSTDKFSCVLSGFSSADLTVNQTLNVTASGASTVNYTGTGIVNSQDLRGSSSLNKK